MPAVLLGALRLSVPYFVMLSPEEMAELWELEAPSIYGLAHARAAVLDSPTWSTPEMEDSESEPDNPSSTLGVPSSVPDDAMSDGPGPLARCQLAYNLDLPCDIDLGCFQPASRQEADLKRAMHYGHVLATDLCSVIQTLPTKPRPIHQAEAYGVVLPPLVFGAGRMFMALCEDCRIIPSDTSWLC